MTLINLINNNTVFLVVMFISSVIIMYFLHPRGLELFLLVTMKSSVNKLKLTNFILKIIIYFIHLYFVSFV